MWVSRVAGSLLALTVATPVLTERKNGYCSTYNNIIPRYFTYIRAYLASIKYDLSPRAIINNNMRSTAYITGKGTRG